MKKSIHSLQFLRGVAAIMVVIFHAQALLKTYESRIDLAPSFLNTLTTLRVIGASGVDLFFVISGFVMAYITNEHINANRSIKDFVIRRMIRIVPLYWLYTTLLVFILGAVVTRLTRA